MNTFIMYDHDMTNAYRVTTYKIIVSLSKKKLTLFKNGRAIKTYPVGIGRILHETPAGNYVIINKVPHPGGPYGVFWMGLSKPHYGIHGTNRPSSIGKNVSKGCVRMYNKDVMELARMIPIGTHVFIQP